MPSFLTEAEVEARNAEFRIARWTTGYVCVYLYRGSLHVQCRADDACGGECDAKCHWLVKPGTDLIVEVYNRADTSIWFEAGEDVFDAENAELIAQVFAAPGLTLTTATAAQLRALMGSDEDSA